MNKFSTYVLRMPETTTDRAALVDGIKDLVEKHGGKITGQSLEDEMTIGEMMEKRLASADIEEARSEAAAIAEAN